MNLRPLVVLTVALACTPMDPAESAGPGESTSTDATGELTDSASSTASPTTVTPTTGDGATDGMTGDTTAGEGTTTTSGDTSSDTGDGSSSTGEPLRPGCGDGVPAAGELCFERVVSDFNAREMVFADLDGDGDLDIVGAREVPCPLVVGGEVLGARSKSGSLDLAAALDPSRDASSSLTMVFALGDGLGGFTAGPSFDPGAGSPRGLVTAEVTGDDVADFLLLTDADTLLLFEGTGDGTQPQPQLSPAPEEWLWDLAAGDLDGDGDIDLLAVGDSVVLLRNDGAGEFTSESFVTDASAARLNVKLHDLDGDGDLDAVVGRQVGFGGAVEVLHNDGTGVMTVMQQIDLDNAVSSVALLPTGPDSAPIVVITANYAMQHLRVAGDGTLEAPQSFAAGGVYQPLIGRFDGDTRPDALLLVEGSLGALLGQDLWPPALVPIADVATDFWPAGFAVGDVNGDGLDDIALSFFDFEVFVSNP